jgi:hypothetical protein
MSMKDKFIFKLIPCELHADPRGGEDSAEVDLQERKRYLIEGLKVKHPPYAKMKSFLIFFCHKVKLTKDNAFSKNHLRETGIPRKI